MNSSNLHLGVDSVSLYLCLSAFIHLSGHSSPWPPSSTEGDGSSACSGAAESSPRLTVIAADTDEHSHPVLRLFLFGLSYTCRLAKVKNKTFSAAPWSVLLRLRSARGREGRAEAAASPRSAPLASRSGRTAARAKPVPPPARGWIEKMFSS